MNTYKIKSILNNSLLIEYRTDNGTLKQIYVGVEQGWDKARIEEEIARQKFLEDSKDITLNLSQYFSKGEELEFVTIISDEERERIMMEEFELEQQEIQAQINQEILNQTIQYRNTPVNYEVVRAYAYPKMGDQLDALYWMRQGVPGPLEEIDKKITEVKQMYPKDGSLNLTYSDLDAMFPEERPAEYMAELKARNIQADFIE